MEWISDYQLFLFDFDGLLVDTEHIHYKAYQKMLADRGYELPWSFRRYCEAGHYKPTGLRDGVWAEFPSLRDQEPDWQVTYREKKRAYCQLLEEGAVELMPGAAELLVALDKADIKRCVVTHSAMEGGVAMIRRHLPILDTIPCWITREDYSRPKPDPEGYLIAIDKLADAGDNIIGFEDTIRGLTALRATPATPVLVCPPEYPGIEDVKNEGILHYESLTQIPTTIRNS